MNIGYFCKICGQYIQNFDEPQRCPHCHIAMCAKDSSCGFCLNCFLQLNTRDQILLKASRILVIFFPVILLLVLLINWVLYLILAGISCGLFIGLYFLWQFVILKKPAQYFSAEWLNTIKTIEYQDLLKDISARRYISKERMQQLEVMVKNMNGKSEENKELPSENVNTTEIPIPLMEYKLIGKPCPKCLTVIQFGDFCAECNIRFCPKCGLENSPYTKICICGFEFTPLEVEFQRKFL